VKKISQKISFYKQEKARIQKAIQDSLSALLQLKTDSSLVALNTDDESGKLVEEAFGNSIDDTKIEAGGNTNPNNEILDPKNPVGITQKKKLEPLWDPRKHFN
jgi:hypothetical protein